MPAAADIVARLAFDAREGTASFDNAMGDIERRAGLAGSRIGGVLSKMGVIAGVAGIAAGAVAAVGKVVWDTTEQIRDGADTVGVSVERYQTLTNAMRSLGVSGSNATAALSDLYRVLGDAQNGTLSKSRAAALERMGVAARVMSGEIASTEELFDAVAKAQDRYSTSAQFASDMTKLVGKAAAQQLVPALRDGGEALHGIEADFRQSGRVIDEEFIARLEAAQVKWEQTAGTLRQHTVVWAADIVSYLESIGAAVQRLGGSWTALAKLAGSPLKFGFDFQRALADAQQQRDFQNRFTLRGMESASLAARAGIERLPAGSDLRATAQQRYQQQFGLFDAMQRSTRPSFGGADSVSGKAGDEQAAAAKKLKEQQEALAKQLKEQAQAAEKLAAENRRLVDDYAPLRKAENAYQDALAEIARAEARGLLSAAELDEARQGAARALRIAKADIEEDSRRMRRRLLESEGSTLFSDMDAGSAELARRMAPDTAELQRAVDKQLEAAGLVAKRFEDEGIIAAQAIAQTFGRGMGGEVSKLLGLLRGANSGDFTSVGGPLGGVLTLLSGSSGKSELQKGFQAAFKPVTDAFEGTISKLGVKIPALGQIAGAGMGGYAIGSLAADALGLGGVAGGALNGASTGAAIGSVIPGIGTILGGIGGALIGGIAGLFGGKTPRGYANVLAGYGGGVQVTAGGTKGKNSADSQALALQLGSAVADAVQQVVDALGAGLMPGASLGSIGAYGDHFQFGLQTAAGGVSKGVTDYATAEDAVAAMLKSAIDRGVLTGIRDSTRRLLSAGTDFEKALSDAVMFEGVFKALDEATNPLLAATRALNESFSELEDLFARAGASAEEYGKLEELYQKQRTSILEGQVATLQKFRDDLGAGSLSPLSLRAQQATAEERLSGYERQIDAGESIDQQGFVDAARLRLDIERQISGSTEGFYQVFDRVEQLTEKALAATAAPAPELDFTRRTADATQASADTLAALLNSSNQTNSYLLQIAGSSSYVSDGFGDSVDRGLAR